MNAKYFILWLVSVFFCTVVHGQKIIYSEGQLQEWKSSSKMQLKVPYYYSPKISYKYQSLSELKSIINEWVPLTHYDYNEINILDGFDSSNKSIINYKKQRHYVMYDDRLEIVNDNTNRKLVIRFADLQNQDLRVIKLKKYKDVEYHSEMELKDIRIEDHLDQFADFLRTVKYILYEKPQIDRTMDSIRIADSIQFSISAKEYRAMPEKPSVTEEQRKFIVQANMFNEGKNYSKAIELYKKVIEISAVSYPAAYYNLALLEAQISRYKDAIFNMKKYLLLVPDAPDVRAAQDKIYEWEAKL
jgi:tetratricopeptide (TPR) repeat protein